MDNEKNTAENNQKDKSKGEKMPAVVAVTLLVVLIASNAIYKNKANDDMVAETEEQVTTVVVSEASAIETKEVTDDEIAAATEPVFEAVTEEITTSVTTDVSEEVEDILKISPLANENSRNYSDIRILLPNIEHFNYIFRPPYSVLDGPSYNMDIEVAADDTYSYGAIHPIEYDLTTYRMKEEPEDNYANDYERLWHIKRYYKPEDTFPYKTDADVRAEISEYISKSFIERHYLSAYEETPGRYTLCKTINGELYLSFPDDIGMMTTPNGIIYNYDGKSCDISTHNASPDIHSDPLTVHVVLEDGKWKLDGYVHTRNTGKELPEFSSQTTEICKNAIPEFKELEKVVLGYEVQIDENDELIEEYDGRKFTYHRVTDERFSNVSEVENYICSHSVGDLRMRCISYIRGETDNASPVYIMSDGLLYCNKANEVPILHYEVYDYAHSLFIIETDENHIQVGLDEYDNTHNSLFLENTEDGWKMYDMD